MALFLAPLFDRVLIAGDSDYEAQVRFGANLLVDQLWSTEELEIVDDDGRFSRMDRLERVVESPAPAAASGSTGRPRTRPTTAAAAASA